MHCFSGNCAVFSSFFPSEQHSASSEIYFLRPSSKSGDGDGGLGRDWDPHSPSTAGQLLSSSSSASHVRRNKSPRRLQFPPLLSFLPARVRSARIQSSPIIRTGTHLRHAAAAGHHDEPRTRAASLSHPPRLTKTDSFSLLDPCRSQSQACARILCLPRPGELLPPPPPLPSVSSFSNPSLFPLYHHQSIYWFRRDMWW